MKHAVIAAVVGAAAVVLTAALICGAGCEQERLPKTARVGIMRHDIMVIGHPGLVIATRRPNIEKYDEYHRMDTAEFESARAAGAFTLLPAGAVVKLLRWDKREPGWWEIEYEGAKWWIVGTFLRDREGRVLDAAYMEP